MAFNNNVLGQKYLSAYPDGRFFGCYRVKSGFDENRQTLRFNDGKNKIVLRTMRATATNPDPLEEAKTILQRHGVSDNSVHWVHLNSTIQKLQLAASDEPEDEVIFCLPEDCDPVFLDERGQPIDSVHFEEDEKTGAQWLYFWLSKRQPMKAITDAKISRNRKRRTDMKEIEDLKSQFGYQMSMAEQENKALKEQVNTMAEQMRQLMKQEAHQPDAMMSNNL